MVLVDYCAPLATSPIPSQARYSEHHRQYLTDGVCYGELNGMNVIAGTGRQVKVRTGRCFIRGIPLVLDSEKSISLASNTSGSNRTDMIVARLDPGNNRGQVDVKTGSTTLTQVDGGVWEIELARVTVANGYTSVSSSDIDDRRGYTVPGVTGHRASTLIYRATNLSVADDTLTDLTFGNQDVHDWSTDRLHDDDTNTERLLAPVSGIYSGLIQVEWDANATGRRSIIIVNQAGTTLWPTVVGVGLSNGGKGPVQQLWIPELRLSAGDWIRARVRQTSGGALNVLGTGSGGATYALWRWERP